MAARGCVRARFMYEYRHQAAHRLRQHHQHDHLDDDNDDHDDAFVDNHGHDAADDHDGLPEPIHTAF
ncbi:hypothetical protein [Chelativorans alearense]|uniref:hypothetical protein n=1 Tax=Chelativorans alearense TaxID=2681495 RepID=UPI0013D0C883|nr:hypothetical protein [Chelativorans alearense]